MNLQTKVRVRLTTPDGENIDELATIVGRSFEANPKYDLVTESNRHLKNISAQFIHGTSD